MTKFDQYVLDFICGYLGLKNICDFPRDKKFRLTRQLLSDQININLPKEAYDSHQRLKEKYYKKALRDVPMVNFYLESLKKHLEIKSPQLWPKGKKCVIGLSHDVDIPEKYAILNLPSRGKNKSRIYQLKLASYIRRLFDASPNDFFLFEDIVAAEEKFGFKSTFFFASENMASSHGSPYDVCYDISGKKFREIFKLLRKKGFGIGLHAGYNAYQDINFLNLEKKRLEKFSRTKILGLRHHFWHLGPDVEKTLLMHEKAGFKYDSSIAFNDAPGFRRSVALPYYPWSFELERPIRVLQEPVFCMDSAVFSHDETTAQGFQKVAVFIKTIKKFGGCGILNWHVRSSFPKNLPYYFWGQTYLKILQYLADDKEIWVTNLEEIYQEVKRGDYVRS